jgi:hypothetical protein
MLQNLRIGAMEKLLKSLIAIFKSKNVDVSNEELLTLVAEAEAGRSIPTPPQFDSIKHNAGTMKEIEAYFTAELDKRDRQNAEQIKLLQKEKEDLEKLLTEQKNARETAEKLMLEKAEKEKAEKIEKTIEELKKNPSFPSTNTDLVETYRKLLTTDYDAAVKMIEALPKDPNQSAPPVAETPAVQPFGITSGLGSGVPQHILDYVNGKVQTI